MIGRIIGTYKIEEKLGEGGMGAVYKGIDTMLDREVAIKALKPELASQTAIVERFRSEAVTLAKLNHPNIATLYSLFRQGDELYMVLEYVRGETLDQIISRRGALPAEDVIPVFCQILDGINHAHEYGIIHRDIKPANMILTETGILKVLDFGIARLLGSNRMTRAGNIIGTLEYMAPEQVKGLETDTRSDTYALGMMLYEVLTGRTPFNTENEFELMKLQTETMPPNPRSVEPSISVSVEAAIMRAIQKNPDDRFQTAGEFRESLLVDGFANGGQLHRNIATNRPITNPPLPPISKPEMPDAITGSDAVLKETRLGTPVPASQLVAGVKETRLGGNETIFTPPAPMVQNAGSFFDRLTPVHYIGAGVAAILTVGVIIIFAVIIFSGFLSTDNVGKTEAANSSSIEKGAGESNSVAPEPTKEFTVVKKDEPSPEPTIQAPLKIVPLEEPSPAQTIEAPRSTEKPKAEPPPKKAAPARPKPAKPRGGTLKDARCALTGDC